MSLAERYARQVALPEVGLEGQQKIGSASVLCIGVGGLGSAAVQCLAATGVGRIGLVDPDRVVLADLHRELIHTMGELHLPKVVSAERNLRLRNPDIRVDCYPDCLTAAGATAVFPSYDVVLDCSGDFPTRFLINDACYFTQRPLVTGGVFQSGGQVTTFLRTDSGPCYRCLYPEPAPEGVVPPVEAAGVSGIAAGVIGLLQANEVLKIITGNGASLHGRLMIFDALSTSFRTVHVRKNMECALCGANPTIHRIADTMPPAPTPTEPASP